MSALRSFPHNLRNAATPFPCPTHRDRLQFLRDGYIVAKRLAGVEETILLWNSANKLLKSSHPLIEYEADLGYPGAPDSREAVGGSTPRRLLQVLNCDENIRSWALGGPVATWIRFLMKRRDVSLAVAHHNCIMTKFPKHSSQTRWHQDIRYWSFLKPELITAWLALGPETDLNGALVVVPGSHRRDFAPNVFDEKLFIHLDFYADDSPFQVPRLVDLEPGDVLFFHCRLAHSASSNSTNETKVSLVFTYHATDNIPVAGTRSASVPSEVLP